MRQLQGETDAVHVHLEDLPSPAALAAEWHELESRACGTFFNSWSWIGPWVDTLPQRHRARLMRARVNARTVGLAIFVESTLRRLGLPCGRAAHLHATGDASLDAVWVEHNAPLLDAQWADAAWAAMAARALEPRAPWHSVVLPCMHGALPAPVADARGAAILVKHESPTWTVDLERCRRVEGGHLALLSAKTRWNVRRSLRGAEPWGALKVSVASDLSTARTWLQSLLHLHVQRWQGRGQASGFATPRSLAFHDRLLEAAFQAGHVLILRVQAGVRDLGYLYCFCYRSRVYFYQCGYDYTLLGEKASPGLAALTLAIDHLALSGYEQFDMLGGDALYKSLLATDRSLTWSAGVHHDRWLFRADVRLRQLVRPGVHAVRRWLRRSPDAAVSRFASPGRQPDQSAMGL